ncbi:MAG: hemoglobin [Verrucomicrobiales bacterium]|jgi:hemoglobin
MTTAGEPQEQTLYDRIGGETTVANLIDDFYSRVKSDIELAPFFENTPMEKLHRMQREFFAVALGGESTYSGRPLSYVHHGLGIKPRHFQKFVEHLDATLAGFKLSDADHQEIISRINTYVDEIIGGSGGVDG